MCTEKSLRSAATSAALRPAARRLSGGPRGACPNRYFVSSYFDFVPGCEIGIWPPCPLPGHKTRIVRIAGLDLRGDVRGIAQEPDRVSSAQRHLIVLQRQAHVSLKAAQQGGHLPGTGPHPHQLARVIRRLQQREPELLQQSGKAGRRDVPERAWRRLVNSCRRSCLIIRCAKVIHSSMRFQPMDKWPGMRDRSIRTIKPSLTRRFRADL